MLAKCPVPTTIFMTVVSVDGSFIIFPPQIYVHQFTNFGVVLCSWAIRRYSYLCLCACNTIGLWGGKIDGKAVY